MALLFFNISNPEGFNIIWNYFGWANQTMAVFTLWAITIYLRKSNKLYIVTLLPALFMTDVTTTFFCIAPECLGLNNTLSYSIGAVCTILCLVLFIASIRKKE